MAKPILREAGEDYLEAVLKLEDENGDVRSIDVARELGVSRPSVNKAMGVLRDMGMVNQEPYGAIQLTPLGRQRAKKIARRHQILSSFLIDILGVAPEIADDDACKMEHIVSEETMANLVSFMEKHAK